MMGLPSDAWINSYILIYKTIKNNGDETDDYVCCNVTLAVTNTGFEYIKSVKGAVSATERLFPLKNLPS